MKLKLNTHKLAAVITAGIFAAQSGEAAAQSSGTVDFNTVTGHITKGTAELPNLISTVAYIGGVGLGVAGVFKLKQHVDNPMQIPLKDGLVRLGAGGGLLAMPFVTSAMQGTVAGGNATGPDYNKMKFDSATFGN